ncbi:CdaR family transcriptional regulator [uncultured Intestinimonas sp.]|uniref:PucR family transcriptional regulator n=1 Tax=uncultured Intestinimonas sp. TaxID=1689265 RepID=UPI0025D8D5C6|nr:helix-turn-helix domain-containing protein [uncultured Intestinimonas sp.]
MDLTMNIILDRLSNYDVHPPGGGVTVTEVRCLGTATTVLTPKVLYVCTASQLCCRRLEHAQGAVILCLGNQDLLEARSDLEGTYLFSIPADRVDFPDLINQILEIFAQFNEWERQLEESILKGKDFQSLYNLSAEVFQDHFFLMWDASYNIVAHTQNTKIPNEKLEQIIKLGFFPKEVTDDLAQMGYMKNALAYSRPTFVNTPNYMNLPFILKTFVVAQRIQYTAVLYFTKSGMSQGIADLFQIFCCHMEAYIIRLVNSTHRQVNRIDKCMIDLVENWDKGAEYLADRAAVLGMKENVPYRLCLITFQEYTQEQALYMRMRIRSVCSRIIVSLYQKSLLLLFDWCEGSLLEKEARAERWQKILQLLPVCGATAAFSSTFSHSTDVHFAYVQASVAMQYGKRFHPENLFHYYRDYYIYHMIDCYSQHFPLEKMYFQKLTLLMDARDYKSSNLYLLRTYLIHERNISQTAKLLYMHRNSVIYRISRIRELLNVDLDDPDIRLRLLISFKVLELLKPDIFLTNEKGQEERMQDGLIE